MTAYTPFHSQYMSHRITLQGIDDDAFAKALTTARVDMNPHQVDAALFALASPLTKGVILADEVGLGKTIEASLVIAQRWAERRRHILLIVPASLRKQWSQELWDKFSLPSVIMEARTYRDRVKAGQPRPFTVQGEILITSYEFAAMKADELASVKWDIVIFDEAHRLRNVHKKGTSTRAKALRHSLREPFKVLLTATPLQNNIMELFGLVSMIDDKVFGDEASFRTLYGGARPDLAQLMVLRKRMEPICRRTLRKDVQEAGHISFTRRMAMTFRFDPHPEEIRLYEQVSAFLQRPDTIYLGGKPNALVTMGLRKILGSSSYAISETLTKISDRLRDQQATTVETLDDIDTIDETADEWNDIDAEPPGEQPDDLIGGPKQIDPKKLAAELLEITGYRDLARSIRSNAKGEKLIAELPVLLDAIVAKGGKRKAVIFTESVRTQKYLAELLTASGFAGDIALLNGSNSDPESAAIYAEWLARNRGTDKISGSKTADMKAAVVEAFRDRKTILIATESGAEGINLQFCSLLVNYDLPWNPQRVEQRIGRCHRYGQQIDVTVVNLLNTQNRAEERVFQLLDQKFRLADDEGWHFFRLSDDNLALELVTKAKKRGLPTGCLSFDYSAYRQAGGLRFADLEEFGGASGWLKVSKLVLRTAGQTVEHILAAALCDDGRTMDNKQIDRLFLLPATSTDTSKSLPNPVVALEDRLRDRELAEAAQKNDLWLGEETEKLDRYADDLEVAAEEEIKRMTREVRDRRKSLRSSGLMTAQQKIDEQRAIKKIKSQIDDKKLETFQRRKVVRAEVEALLDQLQADLELVPSIEPIFTARWSLAA